jgi:hypothetical protein
MPRTPLTVLRTLLTMPHTLLTVLRTPLTMPRTPHTVLHTLRTMARTLLTASRGFHLLPQGLQNKKIPALTGIPVYNFYFLFK